MAQGFFSVMQMKGRKDEEPEAVEPRRGDDDEDDRKEGESNKAYELRKAMESTPGGDTRRDKSRY